MALSWGGVYVSRLNSVRKYRPTTNSSMAGQHERGLHVAQVEYGLELGDKNVIEACGDGLEGEQHRSH